jgi:hypothetical protein
MSRPRLRPRLLGSARLVAASFSFVLFSGLCGVVGTIGGCSDDDSTPAAAANGGSGGSSSVDEPADLDGVIYESEATDEALESVLGVAAIVDDTKAPAISAPAADGEALPAATPATFTWAALTAARSGTTGGASRLAGFDEALSLFTVRAASAHGEPNDGPVYYLEIAGETGDPLARVFTTATSYTPSADVWAAIVAKGGTLSLKLVAARVENNELVAGGGPFTATKARTFTIAVAN